MVKYCFVDAHITILADMFFFCFFVFLKYHVNNMMNVMFNTVVYSSCTVVHNTFFVRE